MTLLWTIALAVAGESQHWVWESAQVSTERAPLFLGGGLYYEVEPGDLKRVQLPDGRGEDVARSALAGCVHVRSIPVDGVRMLVCGRESKTYGWFSGAPVLGDLVQSVGGDIDGDGVDDVLAQEMVHLYRSDGYQSAPYPAPTLGHARYYHLPIGDLDGDGRSDLLISYFVDADHPYVPDNYSMQFDEGVVVMHPGGPRGFRAAAWEIELDEPLFAAITLQLDDDPQLELVGLTGAGMRGYGLRPTAVFPVRMDFAADGTRESTSQFDPLGHATTLCGLDCLPELHPVGDVDGDGYDDVLVAIHAPDVFPAEEAVLHVLTGANDFDLHDPIARLSMTTERGLGVGPYQLHTADMNEDGRLDVAMARTNAWRPGDKDPPSTTLQVWFAPFVDPPGPTATTGDTGQATDTVPPVDTADTAPPTTPPSAKPERGDPKGGCGCTVAASPAAAWLLPLMLALSLRRGRRAS